MQQDGEAGSGSRKCKQELEEEVEAEIGVESESGKGSWSGKWKWEVKVERKVTKNHAGSGKGSRKFNVTESLNLGDCSYWVRYLVYIYINNGKISICWLNKRSIPKKIPA